MIEPPETSNRPIPSRAARQIRLLTHSFTHSLSLSYYQVFTPILPPIIASFNERNMHTRGLSNRRSPPSPRHAKSRTKPLSSSPSPFISRPLFFSH